MAKMKFDTKVKRYVSEVQELRKLRTLRSTRLGDIDKKYNSLLKKTDIVQDIAINHWLDGKISSKSFSPFITEQGAEDYDECCLQYIEDLMDNNFPIV